MKTAGLTLTFVFILTQLLHSQDNDLSLIIKPGENVEKLEIGRAHV